MVTAAAAVAGRVDVTLSPIVGARQRVTLLLNQQVAVSPRAFTIDAPERLADAALLQIAAAGVTAGTYFVRVQVDGAESPLELDPSSPSFGPTVVVP